MTLWKCKVMGDEHSSIHTVYRVFYFLSVHLGYDHQYPNQKHRKRKIQIPIAWLARVESGPLLLDSQLDVNRCPHALGFLPIVAGLLSCHRWLGLPAHGHVPAHA